MHAKITAATNYGCFSHWDLALRNGGYEQLSAWQCDIYNNDAVFKEAEDIHRANGFKGSFHPPEEAAPDVDMIVGSPPCVGVSGANPNARADHPANRNFVEFHKTIRRLKPLYYVAEICEPIFTRGKPILDESLRQVKPDYVLAWRTFDVTKFGSPSDRIRPYFFGVRKDVARKTRLNPNTILQSLKELPSNPCRNILNPMAGKWDHYEPDNRMLMSRFLADGRSLRNGPFRTLTDHKRYLDPMSPAYTVTGFLVESVFHYHKGVEGDRLLAVPEVARLMGFPPEFKFNPYGRQWQAPRYSKIIASGVQIDFTTYLMRHIRRGIEDAN